MESLWRKVTGQDPSPEDYNGIEFWSNPDRAGWLTKQGKYLKTWRRRWFVLKQSKLLWFKDSHVTPFSSPRGVISIDKCLIVKGAEDELQKFCAFELRITGQDAMYFITDSLKEKEVWINSIGRSLVQHSCSLADDEVLDYNTSVDFKKS